jgi:3-oxoacyl-(acyl-carrier-protein) synthase
MKKNKVYITAYSSLTALGNGNNDSLEALNKNRSLLRFPQSGDRFIYPYFPLPDDLPVRNESRISSLSLILLDHLKDFILKENSIPIFIGTSTGGIHETEVIYQDLHSGTKEYPLFQRHFFNKAILDIRKEYPSIQDFYTFSTACSSSGHSILHAWRMIREGRYRKALVLGIDTLSLTTLFGFDSLKLLSHEGCKPLSHLRDGITLGEGGGILLLESDPDHSPVAEVCGCSSNTDGYHISSPDPEGTSQKACMLRSIEQAGITPSEIDFVSAHGTGTRMNDEVEMKTVSELMTADTAVVSLKGIIGHTLGASTAAEVALTLLMLSKKTIYQSPGFSEPMDPKRIPLTRISKNVEYFLKNSFGFGGNNFSGVFRMLKQGAET